MIDEDALIRAYRARRPARLRAARRTGISADRAFRAVVQASQPFRLGTRLRAVPDVRLYAGDDLVRSPGDLLPGPEDGSLDHYLARVAARGPLSSARFQLVVTHPLVLDFALWAEVRDLVRGLFARIGYPVLPVVAELVLGTFARTPRGFTKRLHHAVLTVVLAGRLRARLWDALWRRSPNEIRDFDAHRPSTVLTARAGDVLYWPADRWYLDEALAPCLALRLWIPAAGSLTSSVVKHAVGDLMAERLGTDGHDAVPYLTYPARSGRTGAAARVPPLAHAGAVLTELARGPELARELAVLWARRVSACGLEPAPPALGIALAPAARVRRDPRTQIVRMPWHGESIWAANGHAFALRGGERALRRVLASLECRDAQVAALCGDDAGLHTALELLADVRAIAVTEPEV